MKLAILVRRFLETIPLALVPFVFWLIFTTKTNWRHPLPGAIVSPLLSWFCLCLLGGRLHPHPNPASSAFTAHPERFVSNVPQPMLIPEVCGSIHRNNRRHSMIRGWCFSIF